MGWNGCVEGQPVFNVLIQPSRTGRVVGPVNEHWFADDILNRNKSPVAAVTGVIAIVAQHEQLALWHHDGRHLLVARSEWSAVHCIRLSHRMRVDVEHSVADLQAVAAHPGHPLQVSFRGILRIQESNDVSPPDRLQRGQALVQQRNLRAVEKLVQKKMIAYQDGAFHGSGGHQ